MAAAMGGKPEDVQKLKDELAQLQTKVPDELKPHFEKLKAFIDAAGSDLSKYGTGEFEELYKPIQEWLDKNCK
jgi:DNA phosphorothioation-dependent restriction protein DptG